MNVMMVHNSALVGYNMVLGEEEGRGIDYESIQGDEMG